MIAVTSRDANEANGAIKLIRKILHTGGLVLLAMLSVVGSGCGDPQTATSPSLDLVEQELELWRHETLLASIGNTDRPLHPFETDGCSGGLSFVWERFSAQFPEFSASHGRLPPWQSCCITHDQAYHSGGIATDSALVSFKLRRNADLALRACVIEKGTERSHALREMYGLSRSQIEDLYESIGDLMYRAVRLGGIPCTSESWRWGYGSPQCGEPTASDS